MGKNQLHWKGQDLDSDDRSIEPGYTRENFNCILFNPENKSLGNITNVRGTTLVNNSLLPAGTNICQGAYEDKKNARVFYLVYNSNGNHSIFQYNVNGNTIDLICQGEVLGFDANRVINGINLLDDILKWSDSPNPPYEINVSRGNNSGKKISINLYFGDPTGTSPFFNGANFVISLGASAGVPSISDTYNFSSDEDFETGLAEYAGILQTAITSAGGHYTLTNNGSYLNITSNTPFIVSCSVSTSNSTYWRVFQNIYTGALNQMYLDVIKYPPHFPIQCTLGTDPNRAANLITGKIFQFRYRYIFNELQKSRFSEWSNIPLDANLVGQDLLSTTANFVTLDYSDNGLLLSSNYRQMIKRVELTLREGNTGPEFSFVILEQHQLTGTYKFYNDNNRSAIDAASSVVLFDEVPLDAIAQAADQEVFYANNLEGYDEVPLDVTIKQTVEDLVQPNMWKITGRMLLKNLDASTPSLIFKYNGNPATDKPDDLPNPDNGTDWIYGYNTSETTKGQLGYDAQQHLPTGGFIIYAAGTPYYTITRQTAVGVNDFSLNSNGFDNSLLLPPGKYILRWASNLCNHGGTYGSIYNLDNYELSWQKTSLPLKWVFGGDSDTNLACYEMEIELDNTGGVVDTKSALPTGCVIQLGGNTYNPGDSLPNNGYSYTFDITTYIVAGGPGASNSVLGYLVDNNDSGDPATIIGAKRIEGQQVYFKDLGAAIEYGPIYSDHNGFYWWPFNFTVDTAVAIRVDGANSKHLKIYDDAFWIGQIGGVLSGSLVYGSGEAYIECHAGQGQFIVSYATNMTDLNKLKTEIWLEVSNQVGTRLKSELVVYSRNGNFVYPPSGTGPDGRVGITCYMMTSSREGTNHGRINDFLLVGNNGQSYQLISITPFASWGTGTKQYSSTVFFFAQPGSSADWFPTTNPSPTSASTVYNDFVLTSPITHVSAFKRGGKKIFGIVYFDRGQRSTAICTNPSMEIYFPDFGEDLSTINSIYSKPTYKFGQPQIEVDISNPPMENATHYAIYCTNDLIFQSFLQIVANAAIYLLYFDTGATNPLDQTVSFGDPRATSIYIDISTILLYDQRNPGSTLAYTFALGDRLRILTNNAGIYYQGQVIDVEIKGTYVNGNSTYIFIDALDTLPEITEGSLLEIYTPVLLNSNNLFYCLCSEVFAITTDVNGNSVHAGSTQNQIIGAGAQPAISIIKDGDTYFRQRFMTSITGTTGTAYNFYVEDFNISDFVISNSWSKGRTNIINKDYGQVRRYGNIRFSNIYVSRSSQSTSAAEIESTINGSSSFEVLNNKDSKNAFGPIEKLVIRGLNLFIIQQSGCVSAYLNVTEVKDNADTNLVAVSDQVINTMRPSLHLWGCVDSGSIVENIGRVYYFCREFGCFVRYSQDGHIDINDKCSSRAHKIASDLQSGSASNVRWIATFDQYYGNYTVAVSYTLSGSPVFYMMSFNENENKWATSWEFLPENVSTLGDIYVSFLNGNVYKMYDPSAPCNTFFGTFYKQKFTPVFSDFPESIKTFKNIVIMCNKKWSIPVITTPPNEFSSSGQETEVLDTDFNVTEGVQSAIIMRDKNTPNIISPQIPIISGDPMRGYSIILNMENSETDDVSLRSVDVNYNESKYIPK